MRLAKVFSVATAVAIAGVSTAGMAQGSGQAGAAASAGNETGEPQLADSAHRLVVVSKATTMDLDFAKGCWVRLYDGKSFRGEELMLVGPLQLSSMGTTSPWWRRWNSMTVGPKARITFHSEANHRGRMDTLGAGQRTDDLSGKEIGWFDKIQSARVECGAG